MAPRSQLAQFILDRLYERRETPEQFADRIGINSSGLYKLLRGEYTEPRQSTFDKIAAGLSMAPTDLLGATGRGAPAVDAEEAEFLALLRQLPSEHRPTVKVMLRGLADQPVQPARRANARLEAADKNAEHLQPDLTNEALSENQPRHLRPGKGKLALAHATHWFRLSDSLLAVFQPLLALIDPNRDSGPAAATA